MIQLTENIWIGDSGDWRNVSAFKFSVLNVAHDMRGQCGWPEVEYMQVGLIDGPGNPLVGYIAAVLALVTLLSRSRYKSVLVCCHSGSRSVAVALMYLHLIGGQGWDVCLAAVRERVEVDVPDPHTAHRTAFDKMDWPFLKRVVVG